MAGRKKDESIYLKAAIDNGNSEFDGIINGELVQQPNVNISLHSNPWKDEINVSEFVENLFNRLVVTIASPAINKGGLYSVGKKAYESGNFNAMNFEFADKTEDEVGIINILAFTAAKAVKDYFKKAKELPKTALNVKVDMVASLPVQQHNEKSMNAFTDLFLLRERKHIVHVYIGQVPVAVELEYEFVRVLPEAVSAVFSLIYTHDGKDLSYREGDFYIPFEESYLDRINQERTDEGEEVLDEIDGRFFENLRIAHLDIGSGTTEIPVTIGVKPVEEFKTGIKNGVGHAMERALLNFREVTGIDSFEIHDLSDVFKGKKEYKKYRQKAKNSFEQPAMDESKKILKRLNQEQQRDRYQSDVLVVYGGGSILLRPYIHDELIKVYEEDNEMYVFYVPEKYAVTLNVYGLDCFLRHPAFAYLKEQYMGQKETELVKE
jgi:plasmid segregation protein ParM